jgi:DNA-binding transcriptional ArsR family regulator
MDVEDRFVSVSALLCEPTRARMLWSLLDGRAHTAGELSIVANISTTAASNHLSRLLEANIVRVESQGRHRYYSLSRPEVAYVVEGLANLANNNASTSAKKEPVKIGMKYCRTCYDHLAGFVGVTIAETLEAKGCLKKSGNIYLVPEKGWEWFRLIGIAKENFDNNRRPLTRQCLDWSERRPHLAGQLGAALLSKVLQKKWFRKTAFSRELVITAKGCENFYQLLGVVLQ